MEVIRIWLFECLESCGDYLPISIIQEEDNELEVLFVGDITHTNGYDDWLDGYKTALYNFAEYIPETQFIKIDIDNFSKLEKYKKYLQESGNYVEYEDALNFEKECF